MKKIVISLSLSSLSLTTLSACGGDRSHKPRLAPPLPDTSVQSFPEPSSPVVTTNNSPGLPLDTLTDPKPSVIETTDDAVLDPKIDFRLSSPAIVSGETVKLGEVVDQASGKPWNVPDTFKVHVDFTKQDCSAEDISVKDSAVHARVTADLDVVSCEYTMELLSEKGEVLVKQEGGIQVLKESSVVLSQTPSAHYYSDTGLPFEKLGASYDSKSKTTGGLCVQAGSKIQFTPVGKAEVGSLVDLVNSGVTFNQFGNFFDLYARESSAPHPEAKSIEYVKQIKMGFKDLWVFGTRFEMEAGALGWKNTINLKFNPKNCKKDIISELNPARKFRSYLWVGTIDAPGLEQDKSSISPLGSEILTTELSDERVAQIWQSYRGRVRIGVGVTTFGYRSDEVATIVKNSKCSLKSAQDCLKEIRQINTLLAVPATYPVERDSPQAWSNAGFGFLPVTSQPTYIGLSSR